MKILLNSSAYSHLKRGDRRIVEIVRGSEEILLSTIVIGELLYGFRKGSRLERNLHELHGFLSSPYVTVMAVGFTTADRYARIAASLRAKGRPIPANDIWATYSSGSANTKRLLPALGRNSGVRSRKRGVPVLTATYCRPSTA